MNNTSPSTLTEAQKFENHFQSLRKSYHKYRGMYLKINTKLSGLIPFQPNIAQEIFEYRIQQQVLQGKPIRAFVLKGRQEGISTDTAGFIFHDTASNCGRKSNIVSHEPDSTKVLFEMYKTFYENLPEEIRPMKRFDNKNTLTFENPSDDERLSNPGLKSSISVFTAKKKGGGRSQTIHNLHGSEVAFWEGDVPVLMLGLLQAVPDNPWTSVILESTANGTSGYFHDGYQKAKKGLSDYLAIFIPWWVHQEYERPIQADLNLDEYEEKLLNEMVEWRFKDHKITREQGMMKLAWRRWAIPNKCNSSVKQFMQEYPANDKEAFQKKTGLVYYAFNEDIHMIDHYEPDPSDHIFFAGYDFGAEHPWAYGLFAIDKFGTIYKFRELKDRGSTFQEQADLMATAETHRITGKKFNVVKRFRGHDSGAKQAEREFKRLKRNKIVFKEGIVTRELGITTVNGLFLENKYFISKECVNTKYELLNHVYKREYNETDENKELRNEDGILRLEGEEHKDADVIKENDDCVDGDRYGITSYIHRRPKEKKQPLQKIREDISRDFKSKKSRTGANW